MPGGTATMFGGYVTRVLKKNPAPGISQHLHLCIARRGEIQIWPNDHSHTGRWEAWSLGPPNNSPEADHADMNTFRMPRVATSFDELCRMLDGGPTAAHNSAARGSLA
jgi:hypothetical protein